jgi:hypothetical protein
MPVRPKGPKITRKATGRPFSSRIDPCDTRAVAAAKRIRAEAESFRVSIQQVSTLFESQVTDFRQLMKRAPSALQESMAELLDLADVGPRYHDDHLRYGRRPSVENAWAIASAIIVTANERLYDVEGDHVSMLIENPYTLDSVRDLQRDLTEIIRFLAANNSLAQVPELEDASRRHLIELCRIVIRLLEGSHVERGLLRQCGYGLKRLAKYLTPLVVSGTISGIVGATADTLMHDALNEHLTPQAKRLKAA